MKILVLIMAVGFTVATPTFQRSNYGNHGSYVFLPQHNQGHYGQYQGFPRRNNPQQSQAPTVEIEQVTAEWVCNNYVTGEVKFFGVSDVVRTQLSSSDVERLLKQGVPNSNANTHVNANQQNVGQTIPPINPTNPFLHPQPPPKTEAPNTDGTGLLDVRIGE